MKICMKIQKLIKNSLTEKNLRHKKFSSLLFSAFKSEGNMRY